MCHRLLKFVKHAECGHNSFLGASLIDCRSTDCFLSTAHPHNCDSPAKRCTCRRYYGQPERLITHHVPEKCSNCPQ